MPEVELHAWVAWGVIALAVPTVVALLFIRAPYGRHSKPGWGPTLPARWAWMYMETPPVVLWLAVFVLGANAGAAVPLVLAAMWQIHYIHRAYIFPFRMSADNKRMPLSVASMGFGFNCVNAYVNARQVSELGSYPVAWLGSWQFLLGAALFAIGLAINLHADTVLLRLRAQGGGYKIPHGGLYERISCPNYFGESLEWLGWAIATWSLAGWSFFIFTAANLWPRALANHRWYIEKFPDYPKQRRALLPWLL